MNIAHLEDSPGVVANDLALLAKQLAVLVGTQSTHEKRPDRGSKGPNHEPQEWELEIVM